MPIVVNQKAPVFTVQMEGFRVETTVTYRAADVERWINQILLNHRNQLDGLIVGLDVEWRGKRKIPQDLTDGISIIMICVGFRCLIFQLFHSDSFPNNLVFFLSDRRFKFVGVEIQENANKIYEQMNIPVGNAFDLRVLAVNNMRREDLRHAGLQQLAAEVLELHVEKPDEITLSDWESYRLSDGQIAYACSEAYLSFSIGKRLITEFDSSENEGEKEKVENDAEDLMAV